MFRTHPEPEKLHLVVQPSFTRGMARLVDVFGTLNQYNFSSTPEEADNDAMLSDWLAVKADIMRAMKKYIDALEGTETDLPQEVVKSYKGLLEDRCKLAIAPPERHYLAKSRILKLLLEKYQAELETVEEE